MDAIAGAMADLRDALPEPARHSLLGWEELRAWERRQKVVLPEPYRTFVAETANGTDDTPPEEGGLLPLGAKPDIWTVWEADWWPSSEPFDGTAVHVPGQHGR